MPREMNVAGKTVLLQIESKSWVSAASVFLVMKKQAYPLDIRSKTDMAAVDTDYLIDVTKYEKDEDPATVSNEEKVFLTYRINSDEDKTVSAQKKSYAELMEDAPEMTDTFAKPEKPKLGFFSWLRHKLSFLFGEPDAVKKYDRQMEVHEAKKADLLNKKYGYKVQDYDPALADEKKAQAYITTGEYATSSTGAYVAATTGEAIKTPQAQKVAGGKKPQKGKFDLEKARKGLAKKLLSTIELPGAGRFSELIDNDKKQEWTKDLVEMLSNIQLHIDPPEGLGIEKLQDYEVSTLHSLINTICYNAPTDEDKLKSFARNIKEKEGVFDKFYTKYVTDKEKNGPDLGAVKHD